MPDSRNDLRACFAGLSLGLIPSIEPADYVGRYALPFPSYSSQLELEQKLKDPGHLPEAVHIEPYL